MTQQKINRMLDESDRISHPWWMFDYDKSEYKIRTCPWSWHVFRPYNSPELFKVNENAEYFFREYWRGNK